MDECVRKMTLDEAIENARKVANNCHQPLMTFETMNSIVKDNCREEHEQLAQWLEELKSYKELEEKLCVMFAGECSLSDVVENLERQITEPDKDHPVNARILTYEDAEKWNEYLELEEQGRLLKLPCKIGKKVYIPRCIEECKCGFECPLDDIEEICKCIDGEFCENFCKVYKIVDDTFRIRMIPDIGTRIFLTREETEAKLKEMETSIE